MKVVQRATSIGVALGMALVLWSPQGIAASSSAVIRGSVLDATGSPLTGALVVIASTIPATKERSILTDRWGLFLVPDMPAGRYSVRVTMAGFLAGPKHEIQLIAGTTASLTLNLKTALDVVQGRMRGAEPDEDMMWILRSSRAAQPALWLTPQTTDDSASVQPDYSGYFNVYSKSVETSSGNTQDGMGSQFSVTMPVQKAGSKVTVNGQYNQSVDQPRGLGAVYEFSPMEHHQAKVGVNLRQGGLPDGPTVTDPTKEVQLQYSERFQWSDYLVFDFGGETGRVEAAVNQTYVRPRFGLSWVPESRMTFGAGISAQAPATADDPIRGREYFDRTIQVPPALERYFHSEISAARTFSDNAKMTVTVFRDRSGTQAVFVSSNKSHGLLLFDTSQIPTDGVRINFNREFDGFSAGIGYTNASGIGLMAERSSIWQPLPSRLTPQRFQVVTARFHTQVDRTNTEFTAVYRWISQFAASQIDAYQTNTEFNEPTLTLTMAQDLPTHGTFPGKVQAILDARNLFGASYQSGHLQLLQSPRFFKGGFSIRF
jgi:hypothetical protein